MDRLMEGEGPVARYVLFSAYVFGAISLGRFGGWVQTQGVCGDGMR